MCFLIATNLTPVTRTTENCETVYTMVESAAFEVGLVWVAMCDIGLISTHPHQLSQEDQVTERVLQSHPHQTAARIDMWPVSTLITTMRGLGKMAILIMQTALTAQQAGAGDDAYVDHAICIEGATRELCEEVKNQTNQETKISTQCS